MSHYDSDGSTLVNEERQRRRGDRTRYRSPSLDRYDSRQSYDAAGTGQPESQKSKFATIGKAAIVLGIVGVLLHKWQSEKHKEREREYRRRKRKDFDRAKRARRKEEERREREEDLDEPQSPQAEVRRIEYKPMDQRSRSSSLERVQSPPARPERSRRRHTGDDRGYDNDGRSRSRPR